MIVNSIFAQTLQEEWQSLLPESEKSDKDGAVDQTILYPKNRVLLCVFLHVFPCSLPLNFNILICDQESGDVTQMSTPFWQSQKKHKYLQIFVSKIYLQHLTTLLAFRICHTWMTSVASHEFSRFIIIYTTLIGSCQIFELSASGPNTYGDLKRLESSRCRHFEHEIPMKTWNPFQPRCFMVSTTNISHIKNIYIYSNGMSWPKSQHGAMSCPSHMRWWLL